MTEPNLADALRRALPCNVTGCPNIGVFERDLVFEGSDYYCAAHIDEHSSGYEVTEDADRALISRALALSELSDPRLLDQLTAEDLDQSAPWNTAGSS